ncbi:MAG TPA: insulinase family protein, partial [Deferrisomatales bacterium]|nr:insulinase family protein [Deferrisomatales bacterium]
RGLGGAPPGPRRARPRRPREPAAGAFRSVLRARAVSEIYLELAFSATAAAHPDAPALDLLAGVLGQGEASRLQRRLKLEQNLVCGAGAASYAPLDPGLFQVSAVVESARLTAAYPALCEEVFRLCREPVGDDELERCRENLEADRVYQLETVEGQAQRAGHFHQLCGGPGGEAAYRAALRRVDPAGLRAVARRYLRPERAVLVGLHPADRAPPWTSAWVAEGTCRAATVRSSRGGRRRPGEVVLRRLDNGLRVLVRENPAVPLVAVRAAVLGGQRSEPGARAGVCHLLSQALVCGTHRFSATDIARQVDALGGQLDGFAGRSSWGLRGEFLSRHRRAGLELFAEVLCQPSFPAEEVAWLRDDARAALRLRKDDPAELAVRAFEQALYGAHPYGRDLLGSDRTVAGLDAATLARLHPQLLRPADTVLAVVGDVDAEQVFAFCGSAFGGLSAAGAPPPAPAAPRRPLRPVEVAQEAPVAQAHLVLGFLGCQVDAPDRDALRVAGAMLSGQGGRLFRRLREADGFGYAVELIATEGVDPGYLAAQVTTVPARQEEARQALLEEFAALAGGAFDSAEVAEAQRKLVGGFELALQENASQAAQFALDEVYGLGCNAYRHYPDAVFAVTPREVAEAASRYLAPGHHVAALLSPAAEN